MAADNLMAYFGRLAYYGCFSGEGDRPQPPPRAAVAVVAFRRTTGDHQG
jgi:hypothetical protein